MGLGRHCQSPAIVASWRREPGTHSWMILVQSRVMMLNPVLMRVSAATMQ